MSEYIIAYHGGEKPATPEEGAEGMAKWQAWMVALGDAIVNPGTPLGKSKIITSKSVVDDDGPNRLTGYTIVKAESMDAAIEMAKACPFLAMGTIEVAEVMDMKPPA